jgi:hypothetical protein
MAIFGPLSRFSGLDAICRQHFEKNDDRHFQDVFAALPTADPAFSSAVPADFAAVAAVFCV